MKNTLLLFVLLLTLGALLVPTVHAEKADRNKDMVIEAGVMRYDDVKQLNVFSDNVVLTKGSIVMRAARIETRQDPDGRQFATITGTADKPAFFRQKREGLDEYIEGESELIEYDGRADTVKFSRKAVLRRLRGATVADELTGAVIVYENLTETFSVDGSPGKGAPAATGGRVRAVLTPKPETAPTSAPETKTPVQPSPTLRATTTLGSLPK